MFFVNLNKWNKVFNFGLFDPSQLDIIVNFILFLFFLLLSIGYNYWHLHSLVGYVIALNHNLWFG